MKQQIANRLGVAHARDMVMQFVDGSMTRGQAMASLGVGKTRLYELRGSFLAARAAGEADAWEPSRSGGNHMPTWPDKVQSFLRRALEPDGDAKRYSYAFAAWMDKIRSGQCKLRQPPQDGWWELIWSEWKGSMIGLRGRLLVDGVLCTTECANGTRVWTCRHIDGTVSLVLNKPERGTAPKVYRGR